MLLYSVLSVDSALQHLSNGRVFPNIQRRIRLYPLYIYHHFFHQWFTICTAAQPTQQDLEYKYLEYAEIFKSSEKTLLMSGTTVSGTRDASSFSMSSMFRKHLDTLAAAMARRDRMFCFFITRNSSTVLLASANCTRAIVFLSSSGSYLHVFLKKGIAVVMDCLFI